MLNNAVHIGDYNKSEVAHELKRRRAARSRLLDFTTYTWPEFQVNWHHQVTCDYLDRFARGEIQNLMVFQPAQHGKSELCSRRLPALMLGQNPNANILAASYGSSLIQSMNRDVQRVIDSTEYQSLFPNTTLANSEATRGQLSTGKWMRNNEIFEVVGQRGIYRCAGVGGGLSGFACDIGILDDPYKDMKQAASATYREAVREWYTSVFLRRLHKNSRQLFVLTRWHEEDLAGWLLATQPEKWTVLRLPGLKEPLLGLEDEDFSFDPRAEGEALWPDKFSREQLLVQKALNRHTFEAMTQQNPRPREGAMFKRLWFVGKRKRAVPIKAKRVRRWDYSSTEGGGDWTVGILMTKHITGFYIEDMVRGQWEGDERNKHILETALSDKKKYGHGVVTVAPQDPGSAGKDVANSYKKMMAGFAVETERETGSKEVRARPFADQCDAGNVFFVDDSTDDEPEWIETIIEELIGFPRGKFDDIVDACGGAFNYLLRDDGWVHDEETINWLKSRMADKAPNNTEAIIKAAENTPAPVDPTRQEVKQHGQIPKSIIPFPSGSLFVPK